MARIDNLTNFLNDVASSIKEKKQYSEDTKIPAANFDTEISEIITGPMTQEEYDECLELSNQIIGSTPELEYISGGVKE